VDSTHESRLSPGSAMPNGVNSRTSHWDNPRGEAASRYDVLSFFLEGHKERAMRTESASWRLAAVALALMILGGCASARPTPVNSIEPLVGKWSGTLDQGAGPQPFYLTINPDASLVATWGINWNNGNITIERGVASYQMSPPPREGAFRYYPGSSPSLYMDDTFANFHAAMTKDQ
jgi:hypothetical protein